MKKLKNLLVLSIVFCLCSSVAFSQTNEESAKKTQFIIKGGVNISTIAVNDKDGNLYGTEKPKFGYNLGIAADISLGKQFYFQPNLNLSAKGSMMRGMDIGIDHTVDLSMNALYLQVPLLFAYKFDMSRWNNFFNIAFGPYIAYGVGGNITGPQSLKVGSFSENGFCNKVDVGMNMEFQLELPKIILILGYEYGFTNMIKKEIIKVEYQNRVSYHNSNNYIGIGYKF
jgi:hypothetical protein